MHLTAKMEDSFLLIRLEDNGQGFPQSMIDAPIQTMSQIDFRSGSTSLACISLQK